MDMFAAKESHQFHPMARRPDRLFLFEVGGSALVHLLALTILIGAGLLIRRNETIITPGFTTVQLHYPTPRAPLPELSARAIKRVSPRREAQPKIFKPAETIPLRDNPPERAAPKKTTAAASESTQRAGEKIDYLYYIDTIERIADSNWITAGVDISGKRADPVVGFDIRRDGSVSSVTLLESSGSTDLDARALSAIGQSSFPPLPPEFKEPVFRTRYTFVYDQNR